MDSPFYHQPVMLDACLDALQIRTDGVYVDCTLGGGGHARAILGRLGPQGRLFGIDQDPDALQRASQGSSDYGPGLTEDPRFTLIDGNFSQMERFLQWHGVSKVQGILADLGVSSHQLDEEQRGFAFRHESSPLDMRMDRRSGVTAEEWLRTAEQSEMAEVFYRYGEIRPSRALALDVVKARTEGGISTTGQLKALAMKYVGQEKPSRFVARVFQAIRIHLNQELDSLCALLEQSARLLAQEGRLVIMSYHSLEDRLVKNYINHGSLDGKALKDLYGHPLRPFDPIRGRFVTADEEESVQNPRSRSARLRVGVRNDLTWKHWQERLSQAVL
jgi:16S rRNA (cytosine1402-N4)-methyltransferase